VDEDTGFALEGDELAEVDALALEDDELDDEEKPLERDDGEITQVSSSTEQISPTSQR
jgi:hypothetical protein